MRRSRSALLSSSRLSTLTLCILILSTFSFAAAPDRITASIAAGQSVRLAAGVPLQARHEFDQGAVDPALKMNYMTLLTVPSASQKRALNKLLADQQNPHSASYRKWLTPEQYADRFGLSPNDIRKLTDWLESQGFTIVRTARGRNWIAFSGTAAQVERTFQTEIHSFKVDGEMHFANTTPPALPAALSGVVTGIRGLSNFLPKSYAHRSKPSYTFPLGGNTYFFLAPGDIATMYDLNALYSAGIDGTGEKLAVMGQTDVYLADLNDFRSGFNITQITNCSTNASDVITSCGSGNFQYIVIGTDPGVPNSACSNCDDLPEADIDLEWSNAAARGATIVYVNAPETAGGVWDSWYYAVDHTVAPVITLSYGLCELYEASNTGTGEFTFSGDEAELAMANSEGITFMNSSADQGAANCDYGSNYAYNGYAVSYPASSPEVTGVGGTLIPWGEYTDTYWNTTNGTDGGSALSYIPEVTWNDAQEWGGLCGVHNDLFCTHFGIDDWASAQSAIGIWASGGGVSNCVSIDVNGVCQSGFAQPSWQAGLSASAINPGGAGVTNTPARFSPDVSLLASIYWPGYLLCTAADEVGGADTTSSCSPGGAQGIINDQTIYGYSWGGTSVAAPIFAGIVTLMNQYLGASGLGNINPLLYSLAATPANGAFHPVQTGSDGAFCAAGQPSNQPLALQCPGAGFLGFDASNFDPTTGYNLGTGLGSVDANNLAVAWAAAVNPDFALTDTSSNGDTATVLAGVSGVGYSFTVAPVAPATTFGKAVTFACSGLDATTSCIFNPPSLAGTDTTTDVTLTIATSGPNTVGSSARPHQRADNRLPLLPFTLPIAGVVMVGLAGRKLSRYSPIVGLCMALVLVGLLLACGGSTPISITPISPQSASLWPNSANWPLSTQAFTATVNNNSGLTWSISPSPAGSSIDANGTYTAPTAAAGLPPTVTVTATSQQDSTKSKTATITLKVATVPQTFNNVVVTVTDTTTPPNVHALPPFTLVVQ